MAALSGAGNEGTCTRRHTGTVNSGAGTLSITPDSKTFAEGQQIRLRITQADPSARRWGYEVSDRRASSATTALGVLSAPDSLSQILTSGGLQYAVQTTAGTQTGGAGSVSWEVVWTAPADLSGGAVTFYAVRIACNNDGSDRGDLTYTASLTLQPASTSTEIAGAAKALPHLVFGGGWSTSLYFGNVGAAPASVGLRLIAEDGSDLSVPGAAGNAGTLNLAGHGAVSLDFMDSGPLVSGWIRVTLPEGVIGYSVFRQNVAGRAAQEVVVPLSGTTSASATVLFDDSISVTAAAVLNPGDTAAAVTLTLAPGAKQAFTLRERPGLGSVAGKRGSLEIAAAGGAVSALGILFGDAAFTSIPCVER